MSLTRNTIFVAALIASSAALAQSASKPTDPQIAHIAYTADEIDIKAGQLAKKNSKNPKVVAFAEDMIRDHTAVNEQALALLKKLKVEPEGNETSRTLAGQGEAQLQKLSSLQASVRLAMEIRLEITPLCKRRLPCGTRRTATLPRSRVRRSISRLGTPGALLSRAGG